MKRVFVISLILGCFALTACKAQDTQPVPEPGPGPSAEPQAIQEPIMEPLEEPAQRAQEYPVMLNDGAGILNPGFEVWVEGKPLHWEIRPRLERRVGRDEENARAGQAALRTGPGYSYNLIWQSIEVDGPIGRKTLVFSVDVKCSEPETVKTMIKLSEDQKFYSDVPVRTGEWERLEVSLEVPEDYAGDEFVVVLIHNGSPKKPCLFDNAMLHIQSAKRVLR